MSAQWWLIQAADGALRQVMTDGRAPADVGENVDGKRVTKTPRAGDLRFEKPNAAGTDFVADLDAVDLLLVAQINERREALQVQEMTGGAAKSAVYAAKQGEIATWLTLGAAAVVALAADERARRLPYATAEAQMTGDSLATVISRFQAGAATSNAAMAKVEAIAQDAIARVKAACTATKKQEAAAAIEWKV